MDFIYLSHTHSDCKYFRCTIVTVLTVNSTGRVSDVVLKGCRSVVQKDK